MKVMNFEDFSRVSGGDNGYSDCMANISQAQSPEAATVSDGLCAAASAAAAAAAAAAAVSAAAANACTDPGVDAMGNPTGQCNSDSDGDGGGKVICTELCRNGVIDHDVWMADIRYSRKNFSAQTMRGYHVWGIPYVKLMRKYPAFAKIAAYPTRWFAADIAYRMGVRTQPHYAGWALRELVFRPMCWTIGIVAKARDWQSLWAVPGDKRSAA